MLGCPACFHNLLQELWDIAATLEEPEVTWSKMFPHYQHEGIASFLKSTAASLFEASDVSMRLERNKYVRV